MGRPIEAFLGEVAEFLDEEILPETYSEHYYFDKCAYRVNLDDQQLKIHDLSFCEGTDEGELQRVNDTLSKTTLWLEFHFIGTEPLTGSWTEILSSFSVTLHVPGVDVPIPLKWEQSGERGKLKADEWFDTDREYLETDISAKDAMRAAISEQLYNAVPSFRSRTDTTLIPPVVLQTMYHEDAAILDQLQPNG